MDRETGKRVRKVLLLNRLESPQEQEHFLDNLSRNSKFRNLLGRLYPSNQESGARELMGLYTFLKLYLGTQQNAEAYISLWNKASSATRVFHCVPPFYNNSHGDGHCKQVSVQSFYEVWLKSFTSDARRSQMLFRVTDCI
jgi:hypothetical protein